MQSDSGDLSLEIDSISKQRLDKSWAEKEGLLLENAPKNHTDEVISEPEQFGIDSLDELNSKVTSAYGKTMKRVGNNSNLLGVIEK